MLTIRDTKHTKSQREKQMFTKKTILANSVGMALALPVMLAPFSVSQAQESVAESNDNVEIIQVRGIRKSLESAATIKQDSSSIVDAITAEELGKFPDANVAESLQRVPGVAIARGRGGDGRFVTVRGLGEEFNAVTYNGRLLATENIGREFSFDNIASELVSRAEVYKSAETRLGDGSIGGRVNIVSARPFDNDETVFAYSAAALHDEFADDTGTKASGIFSTQLSDSFGVLASVNYMSREFRVDVAESIDSFSIPLYRMADGEIRGYGNPANVPEDAVAMSSANGGAMMGDYSSMSFATASEDRERLGGTVALQWRPSDHIQHVFDVLYTSFESPGEYYASAHYPCPGCVTSLNNVTVAENGVLTGFDYMQSSELNSRFTEVDTETVQLGWNTEWQVDDSLALDFDLSWSRADGQRDNIVSGGGSGSFYVIGTPVAALNIYDYQGGPVANFTSLVAPYDPAFPRGQNANVAVADRVSLATLNDGVINGNAPRQYRGHFTRDSINEIEDTVLSFKIDGEYLFDDGGALYFGADYVDREKSNTFSDNRDRWCNYFCGSTAFSLRGIDASLYDDMFQPFPVNDFLRDAGASVPNFFPTFTRDGLRALYAALVQGAPILNAEGVPEGLDGLPLAAGADPRLHDFSGVANTSGADILTAIHRPDESNVIEERVMGAYLQMNLEGELDSMPWSLNAGVRVAHTELTSSGAINQIINIVQPVATAPDQVFTFSNDTPIAFESSYTDVLPALNFMLEVSEELYFRAGFAETITRPTLSNLTTVQSVTSTNLSTESIVAGNPQLEPTRSNNLDLSLEYYGEDITASAAIFYKDISDTVANVVTREFVGEGQPWGREFTFTRPTNNDSAELLGLELAFVQLFESGFGYQANMTLVDSEANTADGKTSTLENVSDLTYNLSGFYEDDDFQVRLSYNFRGAYVREISGLQGRTETVDDYGQYDLTASYNLQENLTIYVEGVNLTDEDEFVYFDEKTNYLRYYEERGRRVNLGVRGTF